MGSCLSLSVALLVLLAREEWRLEGWSSLCAACSSTRAPDTARHTYNCGHRLPL